MKICTWCCTRIPFWRTYCQRCRLCLTDKFNCSAPGRSQSCREVLEANRRRIFDWLTGGR